MIANSDFLENHDLKCPTYVLLINIFVILPLHQAPLAYGLFLKK